MSPKDTAYIVERLAFRFMSMVADYERKLVEHRDAFGVRTSADAKIIEGMRADLEDLRNLLNAHGFQAAKQANIALGMVEGEGLLGAAQRVVNERDALRAEIADLRGIFDMVHASLGIKRGDHIGNAMAALKAQTPKRSHPVKVGEWVRRTDMPSDQTPVGFVKQVTAIDCDAERYHFSDGDYWSIDNCEPCKRQHPAQNGQLVRRTVASGTHPVGAMIQIERSRTLHEEYVTRGGRVVPWAHCEPCDPLADHDTPAGKEAAESVIRAGVFPE